VAELSRPIRVGEGAGARDVTVGASVGIAYAGSSAHTPDDLIRDADVAMYRAKQRGRGRVEIFDDALRIAVQDRMQIQDELRRALTNGEIRAYFQPIVNGTTGVPGGFEALARWHHPVRGVLGPYAFVDVAEETGLIVPLGAEMLRQACRAAVRWPAGTRVSVNIAGGQVSHPTFIPAVVAALDETGLDPDRLLLEITETTMMADTEATVAAFRSLRDLGVHLVVDDFGTGYSSLTYLRRFPVETLKIDRSFVGGIGRDPEDEAIVEMVLNLARALHLRVVAEGVETDDQVTWLRERDCPWMQGYHFGRPMPAEQIAAYLTDPLTVRLSGIKS
jgi:predicted signal transduction protein with EAL and GGDEF domain